MGMNIDFTGKTVLVTGAGRGLGKDIALLFADCGADVYLGNRNVEEGQQTVREIEAMGRRAGFTRCDVARKEDVRRLVDDAVAFGGGLDVIVNAAGVVSTEDTLAISDEEFHRMLDINLYGTTHILDIGLAYMEERRAGNIVTISSVAGRVNGGMMPLYCASKAAVINLTQGAARLAAPYGVRVNSVAPGIIRTKMWEQILDGMSNGFRGDDVPSDITPEHRENKWKACIRNAIPLGVAQTGADIAWATAFIASDFAAAITGQVLTVDGGQTMV